MNDKDKVISGLEHCSEDGCKGCPYEQDCKMCDGFSLLAKDALELIYYQDQHIEAFLRDQEPRILTWDEVKHAEVCWLEERGGEPYAVLDAYDWNPEYYGKAIRCWNYKPTKERQKAVKWDE